MQRGIRQVLALPEIILNMEHDIRRSEKTQDIRKNVQRKDTDRRCFLRKSAEDPSPCGDILHRGHGLGALEDLRRRQAGDAA